MEEALSLVSLLSEPGIRQKTVGVAAAVLGGVKCLADLYSPDITRTGFYRSLGGNLAPLKSFIDRYSPGLHQDLFSVNYQLRTGIPLASTSFIAGTAGAVANSNPLANSFPIETSADAAVSIAGYGAGYCGMILLLSLLHQDELD